jgi:hypothetical protein
MRSGIPSAMPACSTRRGRAGDVDRVVGRAQVVELLHTREAAPQVGERVAGTTAAPEGPADIDAQRRVVLR